MRRFWISRWAIALATTWLSWPAAFAVAAPGASEWPVKPGARAPRLPAPRLAAPPPAPRSTGARPATRRNLESLRLARSIAYALRRRPTAPATASPRPARKAHGAATGRAKLAEKAAQRAANRPGTRLQRHSSARLHRGHRLRRARSSRRHGGAPLVAPIPPRPIFLGDLYVQQGGARLYAAYARGQVVGHLPPATIVTNMGREGGWYKVEAPNGSVGYVQAGTVGPTPPPW